MTMKPDQPSWVPVLTLCASFQKREGKKYVRSSRILCLDTRNGRILHDQESAKGISTSYQVDFDWPKGVVEVFSRLGKVKLTFTDQPRKSNRRAESDGS